MRSHARVAPSDSVGFPCQLRFAPHWETRESRGFSPRELRLEITRLPAGFRLVQTLCAFRLGEPPRMDLDSDIPCRPHDAASRLPPLAAAPDITPEGATPCMSCNPELVPRLPVTAHGFSTQNAFD